MLSSFKTTEKQAMIILPSVSQFTFAFTLQPSANSGLVTYWLVGTNNDKIVLKKPLTETSFILQMQGKEYSKANPEGINLFEQIQLDSCFYNYIDKKPTCHPLSMYKLDDLWTLRYNRNPECPEGCVEAEGMRINGLAANKAYPSSAQMAILSQYNVYHHTDFFFGENMFKIFNDINDSEWNSAYEAAK
jgi:hypothetical protein